MLVITKKDILFYSIMLVAFIFVICMPVGVSIKSSQKQNVTSVKLQESIKVVVDAGHGEPDGGAVSADGIKESDLNLQIAQKLKYKLEESNIEVIMTREDENNIAPENEQQNKIRQIFWYLFI